MNNVPADMTTSLPTSIPRASVAVLASGGIRSAVLLAQAIDHFHAVYPIYGCFGMPWEEAEEQHLRRFLASIRGPRLSRLMVLDLSESKIYNQDDTLSTQPPQDLATPITQALHVANRNTYLLSQAANWSAENGIEVVAIGPLGKKESTQRNNGFFRQLESTVKAKSGNLVRVISPASDLSDAQLLLMGRDLPFEFTFSCIRPIDEGGLIPVHCGRCHKCQDRQEAFMRAGLNDRTKYATLVQPVALG